MVWDIVIAIAISLILSAISYAIMPRPAGSSRPMEAAGLDEFDIPTAREGDHIPVIFGTVRVTGSNVVWAGHLSAQAVKKSAGGK